MDRHLAHIPRPYRATRFDGLAQLVGILNAVDPPRALLSLQEHRSRVERLLDTIVQAHHESFTRGIRNYSEILGCVYVCWGGGSLGRPVVPAGVAPMLHRAEE